MIENDSSAKRLSLRWQMLQLSSGNGTGLQEAFAEIGYCHLHERVSKERGLTASWEPQQDSRAARPFHSPAPLEALIHFRMWIYHG